MAVDNLNIEYGSNLSVWFSIGVDAFDHERYANARCFVWPARMNSKPPIAFT